MSRVVKTVYGEVSGQTVESVTAFLGIPYAAPPFGSNRLGPPVRPEPWDGVRRADAYGPTVLKPPYPAPFDELLPEPFIAGQDCLNLNVWTPDPGGSRMPVMVWIHGGAFVNGAGSVPQYAGHRFARDGIVCVTINYRLGCDGYLWLDDAAPNRGVLDQLFALEWVQDNIAAFGGDSGNVTVFGESAGGMSVGTLLSLPRSKGLFRRAVTQSGAGHHVLSVDTARLVTTELASRLGVKPTRDDFASVPTGRLVAAQRKLSDDIAVDPDLARWSEIRANLMAFEPVVDGDIVPMRPIDAVIAGAGREVDLLVGANRDENRLFLVPTGVLDAIDGPTVDLTAAVLGLGDEALESYRGTSENPGEVFTDVLTDWFFRIPAIRLAEAHQGRSHMYEFAWKSPHFDGKLGACHALEIGFVFDTLDADGGDRLYGTEAPRSLATEMHKAWVDFAAGGDPGWDSYEPESRSTMVFDYESAVVIDPRSELRVAWDGIR